MTDTAQTTVLVTKYEVTPLQKRKLQIAISDLWATKIMYDSSNEQDFFAQLGKLHAQLAGDIEYELPDFKSASTRVIKDERGDPTTTAYFSASIKDMRAGKWALAGTLDLDYLPQSRRIGNGQIRYSIPKITRAVAQQVFSEHSNIFTNLEFLDDINREKRVSKKALKHDVFNVPVPDMPQTTEEILEDRTDQAETVMIDDVLHRDNEVEKDAEIDTLFDDITALDFSQKEDLVEKIVEDKNVEIMQQETSQEDDLLDI